MIIQGIYIHLITHMNMPHRLRKRLEGRFWVSKRACKYMIWMTKIEHTWQNKETIRRLTLSFKTYMHRSDLSKQIWIYLTDKDNNAEVDSKFQNAHVWIWYVQKNGKYLATEGSRSVDALGMSSAVVSRRERVTFIWNQHIHGYMCAHVLCYVCVCVCVSGTVVCRRQWVTFIWNRHIHGYVCGYDIYMCIYMHIMEGTYLQAEELSWAWPTHTDILLLLHAHTLMYV